MRDSLTTVLLIATVSVFGACDDGGDDGGDNTDGMGQADAAPPDAPMGGGGPTDPQNPEVISAGGSATYSLTSAGDHFFEFTPPTAGKYNLTLTSAATDMATNWCDDKNGCLCNPGGNCCVINQNLPSPCMLELHELQMSGDLPAGVPLYFTVFTNGAGGEYTLAISEAL